MKDHWHSFITVINTFRICLVGSHYLTQKWQSKSLLITATFTKPYFDQLYKTELSFQCEIVTLISKR